MKLTEAYNILGLPPGASPEEVKKQYRKLTKEFHPDINKEPGAEDKFKKINEANQVITSGKSTDPMGGAPTGNPFSGNPFGRQVIYEVEHVEVHTTISFTDSVLGTRKELKFNRKSKCPDCSGTGYRKGNNGCTVCAGQGRTVTNDKGTITITTCGKCRGVQKNEQCTSCATTGLVDAEASVHVTIPGGVTNGTILRLGGMGNFLGTFMFSIDQYADAFLHVNVIPEPGFSIEDKHVFSKLELTLLEALRGCTKQVKTIIGHAEVDVKPKSRNGDIITIPKMGVNRQGDQKVVLDVKYPKDVNKIIDILVKEGIN